MPEAASPPTGASDPRTHIVIRGARQHNLQGINLDLPKGKLIVITGPSGSGKSSLAFNTIFAEGQRRYTESLSAYARQFLVRLDKPDVDVIMGLAPAIAVEQKALSRNPRSTVATQTEIYDYLRLLYAQIGKTHSPISGKVVTKDSPRSAADALEATLEDGARVYLAFPVPEHDGAPLARELTTLQQRGFFRLVALDGERPRIIDLNETPPEEVRLERSLLLVLADRLVIRKGDDHSASRIADSVDQSFREGGGRCVAVAACGTPLLRFSEHFEKDGLVFEQPTPKFFSFNSPVGACPECQGSGRTQGPDERLVIPDPDWAISQQALAPFRGKRWPSYLPKYIQITGPGKVDVHCPYRLLPDEVKRQIWDGKKGYPGLTGFFRFLKGEYYKMHHRIHHAQFQGHSTCRDCDGYRLRKAALSVRVGGMHIGHVTELTTRNAWEFFRDLKLTPYERDVADILLGEITKRLRFLVDVGLDYLTLDRTSRTLSGGESQRINLATSLGSSLVGSLYVLDEPTIGLHPRDTRRLVGVLKHLRDIGNTVIVVEHDAEIMRHADRIVDLGPGSGRLGGRVIFHGSYKELLAQEQSLTGAYLSDRKRIPVPNKRRVASLDAAILITNARAHNLKRIDARFPLGLVTCVTGVSGSGKSTLVHDTLYRGLARIKSSMGAGAAVGEHDAIQGHELFGAVEIVDQSPIGRTPRSNPVTYTKAFDIIRELLSETYPARLRGRKPGFFSFNIEGGRCDACKGEGVIKVDMQFLADIYLECEDCKGKRYKQEALDVRYNGKNVDDILGMTVDEAIVFFADVSRLVNRLRVLSEVGLGYLRLGQPATTLSGGEAQRIKLAAHVGRRNSDKILYVFDEPTTGLHFDDIRKLLGAFNRLVDEGHSVVVIEHNMDVIKSADWVIDLGPEGGWAGGRIVAEGPPERIAAHETSHTGRFLRQVLPGW